MTSIALPRSTSKSKKKQLLYASILFDLIGMLSYAIPFLGEFADLVWAPIAGILLKSMFKGTIGTVGGIFAFIEELTPGLDFIPTFTLTWMYTYLIKKEV